ncbi:MAG: phosphopantothenoylcysteine decarboxylase [Lentisphaeria bacterium]|nr:phosphopantothenoylcysteine decarboxylase [Lentisphaeria bacterium]
MRILITAGPTREKIDPVRFITNYSTGKMGYALAQSAVEAGHEVVLVSGPVTLKAPENLAEFRSVESAQEMADAVFSIFPSCDAAIMVAAVADYRPAEICSSKMKKSDGDLYLRLERTTDILAGLGKLKRDDQKLIGFAAETDDLLSNAQGKLERKNLDWIAANKVSDGFGSETNKVILLSRAGERVDIDTADKKSVAEKILETVF